MNDANAAASGPMLRIRGVETFYGRIPFLQPKTGEQA